MTATGLTIVVAGGKWSRPRPIPPADFVIAADSGLDRAEALGLSVDLVVGDFDSVRPETLAAAAARGVTVERHPAAKDKTDLELAVDRALERGARRVLLVAVEGGRADHALANLLLLASERFAGVELEAWTDNAVITVLRGRRDFDWTPGDTVSLLAVGGDARGVTTRGLAYPLRGETLAVGSSRGVSNVVADAAVSIAVDAGVLLAIRTLES
jgi:thiamine pyrophosphokinase